MYVPLEEKSMVLHGTHDVHKDKTILTDLLLKEQVTAV